MEGGSFSSDIAAGENEAEIITKDEHDSIDLQQPSLGGQKRSCSALSRPDDSDEHVADIRAGGAYEINHEKLPVRSPIHLKTIRTVIVSEKAEHNVSVKFPSLHSLRNYFRSNSGIKSGSLELDEEFVMGTNLARKVLRRQVTSAEFAHKKHLRDFWMITPITSVDNQETFSSYHSSSALTSTGLFTWGSRRKVRFLGRHRERPPSISAIKVEVDAGAANETQKTRRRRCDIEISRKKKKMTRDKESIVKMNSKDRWSKERYKAAEQKLLDIMREKDAVLGKPILRPQLRMEARKHIGDTGLLDHLLKHMAGMVNEARGERLQRCHNSEGHMEYWLEKADLVDIRKQAGIKDPYWVPPLGWKPGDNPYRDPETASQLKQLQDAMGCMKRDLQLILTKKESPESDPPLALTDCSQTDSPPTVSLEEKYESLVERYNTLEDRYAELSNTLKAVQEEMRELSESGRERRRTGAEPRVSPRETSAPENIDTNNGRGTRSGFRICKPHGTFLWPNMAAASSKTADAAPLWPVPLAVLTPCPAPGAPVKPTPEKPVAVYPRRIIPGGAEAPSSPDEETGTAGSPTFLSQLQLALSDAERPMPDKKRGSRNSFRAAELSDRDSSPGKWLALATPAPSPASKAF